MQFEQLYGLQYQTTNFHNLTHMVDNIIDIGPLWSLDCFPYENASGRIVRMIHGTQHVDKQIIRIVSTLQKLPLFQHDLSLAFPEGGVFLEKMLRNVASTLETLLGNGIYAIGKIQKITLFEDIMPYMLSYLSFAPVQFSMTMFNRFRIKSDIYHCKYYAKVTKRNSYTVQFLSPQQECFYGMLLKGYILHADGEEHLLILVELLTVLYNDLRGASHIKVIEKGKTRQKKLVPISWIRRKCVWMDFPDVTDAAFLSLLPNIGQVS
jgi:hypothetical protein